MAEGTGQGQNTDELAELIGRRGESDKRLDGEEQAAANGETARDQVGALGTLHQGDKSFDEVALGGPVVEDAEFAIARSDADSDPAAEAALAAWSEIDLAIPEFGAAAARATDADAGPAASDGAGGEPGSEQAGDDRGHADLAPSAAALAGGIDGAGQDSPAFVAQTAGGRPIPAMAVAMTAGPAPPHRPRPAPRHHRLRWWRRPPPRPRPAAPRQPHQAPPPRYPR